MQGFEIEGITSFKELVLALQQVMVTGLGSVIKDVTDELDEQIGHPGRGWESFGKRERRLVMLFGPVLTAVRDTAKNGICRNPADLPEDRKHPGDGMPDSAYRHRAWWSNDLTHSQARAWWAAGFETAESMAIRTEFAQDVVVRHRVENLVQRASGEVRSFAHARGNTPRSRARTGGVLRETRAGSYSPRGAACIRLSRRLGDALRRAAPLAAGEG